MLVLQIRSLCGQQRASAQPHDASLLQCHVRADADLQGLLVQSRSRAQLSLMTPPSSSMCQTDDKLVLEEGLLGSQCKLLMEMFAIR